MTRSLPKSLPRSFQGRTLAALVLAFALPAFTPVLAQQTAFQLRRSEIAFSARIYGYNLAEGTWTQDQIPCAAIPNISVLRFQRMYPDGAESLFTVLDSLNSGRVHIVPVLYHGATPFVPAPRNPRNYALFNSLVAANGANALTSRTWLELSFCYAEMTGGRVNLPSGHGNNAEIAGEPAPTVHSNPQDHTASVTFAERDGSHSYRLWSVSFNRKGRIASAQTQEETVYAPQIVHSTAHQIEHSQIAASPEHHAEPAPPQPSPRKPPSTESANLPAPSVVPQPAHQSNVQPQQAAMAAKHVPTSSPESNSPTANASMSIMQPGWKPILNPALPPTKFVPAAPAPPSKFIPNPSEEADQPPPQSQSQK